MKYAFLTLLLIIGLQGESQVIKNILINGNETDENVFITNDGYIVYDNEGNFYLKYDSLGNLQWSKEFQSSLINKVRSVAESSFGNLYFLTDDNNNDNFLIKTDSNGNVLWSRFIDREGEVYFTSPKIKCDSVSDDIYVMPSLGTRVAFLKFEGNGNQLYNQRFYMDPTFNTNEAFQFTILPSGSVIGSAYSNIFIHLFKIGPSGNLDWNIRYDNNTQHKTHPAILTQMGSNLILAGGYTFTSGGIYCINLMTVDTTGTLIDSKKFTHSISEPGLIVASGKSANGNCLFFYWNFNSELCWAEFDGSLTQTSSYKLDSYEYEFEYDFGSIRNDEVGMNINNSFSQNFLFRFNINDTTTICPILSYNFFNPISFPLNPASFLTQVYNEVPMIVLDTIVLESNLTNIVEQIECGFETTVSVDDIIGKFDVSVHPNPSDGILNFEMPQDGLVFIEIFDNIGRSVFVQKKQCMKNQRENIYLEILSEGMYYYRIIQNEISYNGILMIKM